MEDKVLHEKLQQLCIVNDQFRIAFQIIQSSGSGRQAEKIATQLNYIALELLHIFPYFQQVADGLPEELPKLLFIATNFNDSNKFSKSRHLKNCLLLSYVAKNRQDLLNIPLTYFTKYPAPFDEFKESNVKKRKMDNSAIVSDIQLVEAVYFLLKSNLDFYRVKWNWSQYVKLYLDHKDEKVVWIACKTLSILFGMSENQSEKLQLSKLSTQSIRTFSCVFDINETLSENLTHKISVDQHPMINLPNKESSQLINISGIYLTSAGPELQYKNLIQVPSTINNLRKICLGLSSCKAVCMQGPVGSGKTTLVEYLAAKTGRKLGETFIKVQLGDETDSKMLLGTYRCTDIPGEFIWQPGVLTQAVVDGNWLLLEDIDSASMDIASVLTSLLENRSLAVPGFRDSVSLTPGFQLFVTQRLLPSFSGGFIKKHTNSMALLEKHLMQINIDPLSLDELKEIIVKTYPEFETISERLINVFKLFSENIDPSQKLGRQISTRDFFKWLARAAIDFDVKSQESALRVLQNAIDVFCCSYSNPKEALSLAKAIATNLGIINQKAEYFLKIYKPNMQLSAGKLIAGRCSIQRNNVLTRPIKFSFTRPSSVLLERIMCCINLGEPVLLVGETGTGKTSSVQYLANIIGQKLIVINMNQQSDSADLLGGFKPVDLKFVIAPIRREFESIFQDYFKVEPNKKYLSHIANCFNNQRWQDLLKLMNKSTDAAIMRLTKQISEETSVGKLELHKNFLQRWEEVNKKLAKLSVQLKQKTALAFAFIEGSLVKAVENGYWVLLDEINLANAETLECLSGLLEGTDSSLCLLERGDKKPVKRHPNFTLFACMNPSTDIGKKDLPAGLRNRFTEFFVDELTDSQDLHLLVNNYLEAMSLPAKQLDKIVNFYLKVRKEALNSLSDGLGHRPHFSLRSLCRALMISSKNPCGTFNRSLYEAFCLSFLTQLDCNSYNAVEKMISDYLIGADAKRVKQVLNTPIQEPREGTHLQFEGYWIKQGSLEPNISEEYILTSSVRKNLKDLARVVSIGRLPVLLQGDTSVGKTSLITYLAKASGNKCVRINNHEHTDLQEYIGSYVADSTGKLVFREGLLVEAMRKGHWIILDELNLAPTDVLEALNRVLDDNRELFIPETQETVEANPNFMLFATQNPPGAYGGRKMLSRAFRNRFVELHFNEIPPPELEVILQQRCQMPPSYAKKMINVMTHLQMKRRGSAAFAGKHGFMTLRDLFRWGERYRLAKITDKLYDWDQHLADEGYLVLAGRVRKVEEREAIVETLQKHLKRQVHINHLFTLSEKTSFVTRHILEKLEKNKNRYQNIVWTFNMRQLAVLVGKAMEFKEPVLLVGETGGGKTTICKIIAENNGQQLVTVNCHMHTESSDFIGGLRPVRDHSDDESKLFEWVDGPLIQAMLDGNVFLADEISLADDSVLERLNSLLEPERSLLLAEKGIDLNNAAANSELIIAHANFHFIGTMNPGGDFGKKELSPALRNRFTEIWCEACTDRDDLVSIIEHNIKGGISLGNQQDATSGIGISIMDFIEWMKTTEIGKRFTTSIRDILTWVNFINNCEHNIGVAEAYLHGACLTFLDSLGSGVTASESGKSLETFRKQSEEFLENQLKKFCLSKVLYKDLKIEITNSKLGIKPFYIKLGNEEHVKESFSFDAPTTLFNAQRLLRGMQLEKAILLEGSPGVGKTSLVSALAKSSGHKLFRINLSDQTDISDLFGADLPVEGGTGGQFSWRDGPLLQALKDGSWILLDELNLASQSVLEGLNACLDHRGEIFIPELGKTFHVQPGTKFFACQNPLKQGGSRRGLPQSFLNRFIQVYITSLTSNDLLFILRHQFKDIPTDILSKMISFNERLTEELNSHSFGNKGGPWECNLRDLTRWCEVMLYRFNKYEKYEPESVVSLIYADRMRTKVDKERVGDIFQQVFGRCVSGTGPVAYVNKDNVHIGDVCLIRGDNKDSDGFNTNAFTQQDGNWLVLRSQLPILRSLAYCVNLNWMSILVGSSGCGKSSVVKTLANLTGKTLKTLPVTSAMDTTDILGGFEQTDYTRHLEEIVKDTEQLLYTTLQQLFVNAKSHDGSHLLMQWESYLEISADDDGSSKTMQEECKLFLRKLHKLQNIWTVLIKIKPNLKEKLSHLKQKAQIMENSVQQEGSLNAGGKFEWVDSILIKCLQRGDWLLVDNVNLCSAAVLDRLNALLEPNGVLTISERGVDKDGRMIEIRPHKEFRLFLTMDPKNGEISRAMRNRGVEIFLLDETNDNLYDNKSLINFNGLENRKLINTLLNLHDFISDLILSEKPNINEILQTSQLIAQQLNHGVKVAEAFYSTIIDVYYKTRSPVEFNCNDTITVIKCEIDRLLEAAESESDSFNECVTLKTCGINDCSMIEKVKQNSSLLFSCSLENNCKYFLMHFYAISSKEDLQLRHYYLNYKLVKENKCLQFKDMIQSFYTILEKQEFKLPNMPMDNRWISRDNAIPSCNKLNLFLHICSNYHAESNFVRSLALRMKSKKHVSLLDYMYDKRKKSVEDKFNNSIIDNFLELIEEYDNYMKHLDQSIIINDEGVVDVIYLITWRFIFFKCVLVNIKNLSNIERYNLVTNITVHYKWFLKYAVETVAKIFNSKLPHKLQTILQNINSNLDRQFAFMFKVGRNYQKCSHKPPPHLSEQQFEACNVLQEILRHYNLCDPRRRQDVKQIIYVFHKYPEFREKFVDLNIKSTHRMELITLSEIELLKMQHEKMLSEAVDENNLLLELLPISDVFSSRLVRRAVANNEQFDVRYSLVVPSDLAACLIKYHETDDKKLLHEIESRFYQYLMNSPSIKPDRFLCKDNTENKLEAFNSFNPLFTLYLTRLLVNIHPAADEAVATLGNYRDLSKRNKFLNELIWDGLHLISDDFLLKEELYANNILKSFVQQLATSLNIPLTSNCKELFDICEQRLIEMKALHRNLKDPKSDLLYFVNKIQNCLEVQSLSTFNDKLLFISDVYMEISYAKASLNSKLPLIDPLAKKSLKKTYVSQSISEFDDMKSCYELLNQVYSNEKGTIHPYYYHVSNIINKLEVKSDKLNKNIAFRTKSVLYETVYKVINHSFTTILSREYISQTILTLNNAIMQIMASLKKKREDKNEPNWLSTLSQYESNAISYENLLNEWENYRNAFPDIVQPLLCNISEFLYGFKLKLFLLRKLINEYKCTIKFNITNKSLLIKLIQMPSINKMQNRYDKQIKYYFEDNVNDAMEHIFQDNDLHRHEMFRLLKCGLQETFNHCLIHWKLNDNLNKDIFLNFATLLNNFVKSWNKQEEDKEIQQKEAESLYKTKSKCDDKSEVEQIEEEFKLLFPNYHDSDFSDLNRNSLDDLPENVKTTKDMDLAGLISLDDLKNATELHVIIVKNLTKCEWLNGGNNKKLQCDFVKPLMEKFKLFRRILEKTVHGLDYSMDKDLIGSLNILVSVASKFGDTNEFVEQSGSPVRIINRKSRDFYKDSDIEEVKSSYHILGNLKNFVTKELLDKWPDHPTLNTIILVIDRILAFNITSPLSRFLTGFEILLSKCHEWEEVAHAGVSLAEYSQEITQQIISWRKMELSMWKDLLNITFDRINESAIGKWWIYLYNIMQQFVVEKLYSATELIDSLQAFITKSTVAEFQMRLDLLYAFHCHATYLDRTKEVKEFINILWNLHNYFQQFSTVVANKIKDLRSPIEKKLKDYVKIVRWKDISYWAIKETMEKSHKTLHKYMREFKEILLQPVSGYLVNTSGNDTGENVGIWDRPQRQNPKAYHYTLDVDSYLVKRNIAKTNDESESMGKLHKHFLTSRKLCKEIISSTKYPTLVQNLDGFIAEVIETSSHLQKLEVDTTLEKSKQKSQAKSILQQKHRALADLFKTLSKIGLSFRTGIIEAKLKNPAQDFLFKPIDLNANFSHLNYSRKDEKILTIWDSCEMYYTKAIMRADVLEGALKSPAPDLGIQNIERCKGFSLHLITLAQQQKTELIKSTRHFYYLYYYFKQFSNAVEKENFVHLKTLQSIDDALEKTYIVMNQIKIVLNACPSDDDGGIIDEFKQITVPKINSALLKYKNDELWCNAVNLINKIINQCLQMSTHLHKCRGFVPSVECELLQPQFISNINVENLKTDVQEIANLIKNLDNALINVVDLKWLINEFENVDYNYQDVNEINLQMDCDNLTEKILLVFQNVFKKYNKSSLEEPENEENVDLSEDHFKKLLVDDLVNDLSLLDLRKIVKQVGKIANQIFSCHPKEYKVLAPILPLLEQLTELYKYFITQQVSAYRVTCKMASILLNIFIELVSKGFCVPPELSDEMDSEGISKPSDGLGLGEGEGERDVSDKIESEDQLDDAQPAGQEKENKEDPDCKEEDKGIEMSEDFDSKLQDKQPGEDEDDNSESDDGDADEQMGETDKNADKLDKEIWGDEDEPEEEENKENEQEEKGDKGEKEGEDQLGAKESNPSKQNEKENKENGEEKEQKQKEINEMEEPEYDDEQTDPYHGNQPELPEPEPMDLPDDLQLDDGEEKDVETQDDNPFDIDNMKEDVPENKVPEEESTNDEDKKNDEAEDFSSDDEDIAKHNEDPQSDTENTEDKSEENEENKTEKEDLNIENIDETDDNNEETNENQEELDHSQTVQDNVEAMDVDEANAANDKTESTDNQKSNQPIDELCQEDKPDKEGVGQSQMEESKSGHSAQTNMPQEIQSKKREREEEDQKKQQKPGESDSKRTLGNIDEQVQKKLKTIEALENSENNGNDDQEKSEAYQHIENAKEKSTQVLDAATKEQAENQKELRHKDNESDEEAEKGAEDLPEDEIEPENIKEDSVKPEKVDKDKKDKKSKSQHPEGEILDDLQEMDVEGDLIETQTVPRNAETTHHTLIESFTENIVRLTVEETNNLRQQVENQLGMWNEPPSTTQAEEAWQKISSVTSSLAQDLSEQLRLVLEPTLASRLKGDFRTGRRINMRKVIPYIASQFRKDKIWLRRTKPSKREYQIVLAIDDSSSMADNHSKELAFESVALISKALTLLESGQLSVLSFGEKTEVLHKLTDQFTDKSGVKLLQKFQFNQNKTCIAKLVDFATEMLLTQPQSALLNAKLLVIVSDGRGVFSEGEHYVKQAVRRAKLSNIFIVFVIIDNPANKSSILDIRMPVFKDGTLQSIKTYMDVFPFSFYIILRDINSLPNVLSDALRQWFEMVSNLDKR